MSGKKINKIWCVIPVYNNSSTILNVVKRCEKYIEHILVVDDGSNDGNLKKILCKTKTILITHKENKGKGAALKTALNFLTEKSADYMIVIDGDAQHYPEDIPNFIETLHKNDHTLVIGCRDFNIDNIPESSRFGRKFSNMWVRLETGLKLNDTQSGFRAYPVKYISKINTITNSYNYEIEILVKAAWKGIDISEIQIKTYYPDKEKRISHFKPFLDNLKLSLTHTMLVTLRLLPLPNKKIFKSKEDELDFSIIFHPVKLLKMLIKEHSSPDDLALAAFLGTLLAVLPIPGFHSIAIIYAATRFKLNRVLAFNIQHFFMPPVTPVLCIELGHYLIYHRLLLDVSFQTIIVQLPYRILEWIIGSLILAPLFAVVMGFIVYFIAKFITNGKKHKKIK